MGADSVLCSWPLPKESILTSVKGECHVIPQSDISVLNYVMYGVEGWIVQSTNAADFQDQNTLWDTAVPKDDSGDDDLDISTTEDVTSFIEAGEVTPSQLFDQELLGPKRVFQREKMLSFANAPSGFKDATPDTYIPGDQFDIDITTRYKVQRQSGLLFAFGAPDFLAAVDNDVVPQLGGLATNASMYALRFLGNFLDNAMVSLIGLEEAGAETPYVEILDFIEELLEKVNVGSAGGSWFAVNWSAGMRATAQITVPGFLRHNALGPDSQAR